MTRPDDDRIHADPITVTALGNIPPDAISFSTLAPDAVETGNIIEDLRNGDPKMVEALILTALARTTLNGVTDMGKEQARHYLDLYKQHVIDEAQQ
ncbi:hypothetical protein ACFQ0X_44160 [Streptomyces rectiviolaceus]|uniref:Uncharacterized protein n=1 Tax=Streptomyces rectiviolaceus TaxID=332591 RepID=A0ABP6NQ63_9ACTN